MIDKYFIHTGHKLPIECPPDFTHEQSVIGTRLFTGPSGHDTLTVVFPPWNNLPSWLEAGAARNLARHGSDTLLFRFNPFILNPNAHLVRKCFDTIAVTASQILSRIIAEGEYDQINLHGFSLGNVTLSYSLAQMEANEQAAIGAISMVVPGTDLADGLWFGDRTRLLKEALEQRGETYESVKDIWQGLGPYPQLEHLVRHDIDIVVSQHDNFIPTADGRKLGEAVLAADPSASYREFCRLGHVATTVSCALGLDSFMGNAYQLAA